jgi:hypothetical protein
MVSLWRDDKQLPRCFMTSMTDCFAVYPGKILRVKLEMDSKRVDAEDVDAESESCDLVSSISKTR